MLGNRFAASRRCRPLPSHVALTTVRACRVSSFYVTTLPDFKIFSPFTHRTRFRLSFILHVACACVCVRFLYTRIILSRETSPPTCVCDRKINGIFSIFTRTIKRERIHLKTPPVCCFRVRHFTCHVPKKDFGPVKSQHNIV